MTHTLQKNLIKALVAFVSVAVIVATFMVTVPKAHAVTIEGKGTFTDNNRGTITAVQGSSTVAFDTNNATAMSGESALAQTLNRLFVMIGQTCVATSTDATIKTGAGQLSTYWGIRQGGGDLILSIYDATTTGATSTLIGYDNVASTSAGAGQTRWGGEFATGAFLDVTGTGVVVTCYR